MKRTVFLGIILSMVLLVVMPVKAEAAEGRERIYQNGVLQSDMGAVSDWKQDRKKIEALEGMEKEILTNYPEGYQVTLPAGLAYDFSLSGYVITAQNDSFYCAISVEESEYEDLEGYVEHYQNRFYTSQAFQEANGFLLQEDAVKELAGYKTRLLTLTRQTDSPSSMFTSYTFAYQFIGGNRYIRYLFKSKSFDEQYQKNIEEILDSFQKIEPYGTVRPSFQAHVKANPNWNEETTALYQRYLTQTSIDWGIFTGDVAGKGIEEEIPRMEEKIGIPFEIVLLYRHLGEELPMESMKKMDDSGKVIELTVQTSFRNNEDLYGYTPIFDIVEGKQDEKIRALARQIKEFQKPVLFRLNNEMNSDWTSYSGIIALSDPELYQAVWVKFYEIFEEEQVQNAIWVWNPNDIDYPPSLWNAFLRYYPGDDYVQMIGITGYNTGTYYRDVTNESWREFDNIYGAISEKYSPYFKEFPWIITEFSCSSHGGDKALWIENMFKNIGKYKNIKAAVWFSYPDFDYSTDKEGIPARTYWLDETPETLEAFKTGRQKLMEQKNR